MSLAYQIQKDYTLYAAENIASQVMQLRGERNPKKVKGALKDVMGQINKLGKYDANSLPIISPILNYTKKIYVKTLPTSFDLLVLASKLRRIPHKMQKSRANYLGEKSFDSVYVFEKANDIDSLMHLASSSSGGVAVASVRALGRVGNLSLLKKACLLGISEASFEAILLLERKKALQELLEVAIEAKEAVALKAVEALGRLRSADGLLSVAMHSKSAQVALFAVSLLERIGAVSALKALSLLSGEIGKAAYEALVKLKMAGLDVGF